MHCCRKELGPITNAAINYTRTSIQDWLNRGEENGQMGIQVSSPVAALYVGSQLISANVMQSESVSNS